MIGGVDLNLALLISSDRGSENHGLDDAGDPTRHRWTHTYVRLGRPASEEHPGARGTNLPSTESLGGDGAGGEPDVIGFSELTGTVPIHDES